MWKAKTFSSHITYFKEVFTEIKKFKASKAIQKTDIPRNVMKENADISAY